MSKSLPDSLPQNEQAEAKKLLLRIGAAIIFKKKFYFTNYVPFGQNCVNASIDRGNWLVDILPAKWWIDVYTWPTKVHTANVVYFLGSDGYYHCWVVDGYGYPVTQNAVEYLLSQGNQPGEALDGGKYLRTMADAVGIKGVFPAIGKGQSSAEA